MKKQINFGWSEGEYIFYPNKMFWANYSFNDLFLFWEWFFWYFILFLWFSAPEIVNYEPLGLEADMW